MIQLLLLLQQVPLPHLQLLLLQVLQVHLLLLLGQLCPSPLLLLLGLGSRIRPVLLRQGLLLLALHCHLLHLLLHDEVLLLLLEEHQLLMLGHTVQLARRDFRIEHELLVPVLKGVPLEDLLLLRREAVHDFTTRVMNKRDSGVSRVTSSMVVVKDVLLVLGVDV